MTHIGEKRNAYRILVGNLMERHHSEDLGIDGRLILKGILNNRMEGRRLD